MRTPWCLASGVTPFSSLVLKPMITAPPVPAMSTSFLVTRPTSVETISSSTLVVFMPSSTWRTASVEPKTSVLMMTLSTFDWFAAMSAKSWSTDTFLGTEAAEVSSFLMRFCSSSARSSAARAFLATLNWAPLSGAPDQPMTRTGMEGGASLMLAPLSSNIARTLHQWAPQTRASPIFSVPRWTRRVASGPRPTST